MAAKSAGKRKGEKKSSAELVTFFYHVKMTTMNDAFFALSRKEKKDLHFLPPVLEGGNITFVSLLPSTPSSQTKEREREKKPFPPLKTNKSTPRREKEERILELNRRTNLEEQIKQEENFIQGRKWRKQTENKSLF